MSGLLNIMDILIIAILALSVISGMYRGFIASGLHTFGFIGSWFVARFAYAKLAAAILGNRALMSVLSNYLEANTFFSSTSVASMTVTDAVNSGQLSSIADAIGSKLPFIRDAFYNNVLNSAFSKLNIWSLEDYLDQTVFQSVFNILSFLVVFAICYALIVLVVNLFNHIFDFPALRTCDSLVGGLFGFLRGVVVVVLFVTLVPMVLNALVPEYMEQIEANSKLLGVFKSIDYLQVQRWISNMMSM